jgi:hypothetical protein
MQTGALPPEIWRPLPRKGYADSFQQRPRKGLFLEVSGVRSWKFYTEVSSFDDRGWWPRCKNA